MIDDSFRNMMQGYGLTTAQIFYRLPDAQSLINEFIYQFYDIHPKFPELHNFLDFWTEKIEGPIHSVTIVHKRLISPSEFQTIEGELRLN